MYALEMCVPGTGWCVGPPPPRLVNYWNFPWQLEATMDGPSQGCQSEIATVHVTSVKQVY